MENNNISEALNDRIKLRNSVAPNEAIKGMPQRSPSSILEEISSMLSPPSPPATETRPYVQPHGLTELMEEAVKQRVKRRSEEPSVSAINGLAYESEK
jgi:hypothetical protein